MRYKQLGKLKKNKEFSYIYKVGKKIYIKDIGIFWIKTKLLKTEYGITTSKKFKNAVSRNKIRRRVRNIIKEKDFSEKFKFVIYIKETALTLSFAELKAEILSGLLKVGIIK